MWMPPQDESNTSVRGVRGSAPPRPCVQGSFPGRKSRKASSFRMLTLEGWVVPGEPHTVDSDYAVPNFPWKIFPPSRRPANGQKLFRLTLARRTQRGPRQERHARDTLETHRCYFPPVNHNPSPRQPRGYHIPTTDLPRSGPINNPCEFGSQSGLLGRPRTLEPFRNPDTGTPRDAWARVHSLSLSVDSHYDLGKEPLL